MKIKSIFIIVCLVFIVQNSFAGLIYPAAKVTVKAIDTKGNTLEGAEVKVCFYTPKGAGMGWGTNTKFVEGTTDKKGQFTAEGETTQNCDISVKKEGFYTSSDECKFEKISALKHWEPWNPTVQVVLKEKRNPVPMYAKRTDLIKVPALGKSVGYDLEKGDWVSPYGVGIVSDFIFTFISRIPNRDEWECSCKMTFSNPMDGILEFRADSNDQSEYRWPYEAPETEYMPERIWFDSYNSKKKHESAYDGNKHYIFRVRTVTDDRGKIVSALYGKMAGDVEMHQRGGVDFKYYINPSGTRNLEYDHKKALFKWKTRNDLSEHEVYGP